jgi:hypothetical protein
MSAWTIFVSIQVRAQLNYMALLGSQRLSLLVDPEVWVVRDCLWPAVILRENSNGTDLQSWEVLNFFIQ